MRIAIRAAVVVMVAAGLVIAGAISDALRVDIPEHRPELRSVIQPAPEQDYPDWLYQQPDHYAYHPDWAVMESCWVDRFTGPQPNRPGCPRTDQGDRALALGCHWTVDYPSRYWVEQACGPISGWGPEFGRYWYQGWDEHPARDWVENLRAGGQP